MKYIRLFLIIVAAALAGCSSNYDPDCRALGRKSVPTDEQQVEIARQAWKILSDSSKKAEWPGAMERYNGAVLVIAQRMRCNWRKTRQDPKTVEGAPYEIIRPNFVGGEWSVLYEDAIPCADMDTSYYLKERVFAEGVGVPLAGFVKSDVHLVNSDVVKDSGNVHTITAVLDFDHQVNGKPSLRVIPRLRQNTIKIGKVEQPLAADFTCPIAMFWERTEVGSAAILGLFNAKKASSFMGLYFSEPYDPGKIPVLFTHGLMSSPATFANLVNRLQADPVIRKNYQFWYYGYPSGPSWVASARQERLALEAICNEYDPGKTNPNMNRIVMVGHSMGGLITRLNMSTRPWTLLCYMLKDREMVRDYDYEQARKMQLWDAHSTDKLAEALVFEPNSRVKRIVFMATPHKGSDFANRWFGILGQRLIRLPERLLVEITRIGTLSSNMLLLNPERLTQEFTSIGQLSPNSPFIKGVQNVYPEKNIKVHSIIGDRGHNDTPHSSDGVVDYYSSHLPWAVSESIVPSGHSVQHGIPAAGEMRRILREHLQSEGISTEPDAGMKAAPTIWQENPIQYLNEILR